MHVEVMITSGRQRTVEEEELEVSQNQWGKENFKTEEEEILVSLQRIRSRMNLVSEHEHQNLSSFP